MLYGNELALCYMEAHNYEKKKKNHSYKKIDVIWKCIILVIEEIQHCEINLGNYVQTT
jgi:hypothetical protein